MSDVDRTRALCDLLLGAAYADAHVHERETTFVRAYLVALCGGELPPELAARIDEFDVEHFDVERSAAAFADATYAQKRDLLEILAALHDADNELDLAEDEYLRAVARALGAEDALGGLVLSYASNELRAGLDRLGAAPPPLPAGRELVRIRLSRPGDAAAIAYIYNFEVKHTALCIGRPGAGLVRQLDSASSASAGFTASPAPAE